MKAIQVEKTGSADHMHLVEVPVPRPGRDEVLVRVVASGVNFIDVYFRSGLYKADLPVGLGSEGAGVVEQLGDEVTHLAIGDRVAYAMVRGSYAEFAVVPGRHLVRIPDDVDFITAAGIMLQGMTAHYLTRSAFPLNAGDACLVHAAAGGTGGLVVQMARHLGARILGTVSTDAKAAAATDLGVHEIIRYTDVPFDIEVKRLTEGRGVDVVYDSVGQSTFEKSLNALRPRGTLVLFGQSSGPVPPFDPAILNQKGSLFLTRPSLAHYLATREELIWRAGEVFEGLRAGWLRFRLHQALPLAEAARAHRLLEGRQTTGKVVLVSDLTAAV